MSTDASPEPTAATLLVERSSHDPKRYDVLVNSDLWPELDERTRSRAISIAAALLGLDLRDVRKRVNAGAPLRQGIRASEVAYLRQRFLDFDLSLGAAAGPLQLSSEWSRTTARILAQALSGTAFGLVAGFIAPCSGLPGRTSLFLVLMGTAAIGIFWEFRRPAMTLRGIMGLIGVIGFLFGLEIDVTPRVARWLDDGSSSNFNDVLGAFLFLAVCNTLAAPLAGLCVGGRGRTQWLDAEAAPANSRSTDSDTGGVQ